MTGDIEAKALLRRLGLRTTDLVPAIGMANSVWLTPTMVVRFNEGRFRDAFRHEARILEMLPATVPHPALIAWGVRDQTEGTGRSGEFLVIERLSGRTLDDVWPTLTMPARRLVMLDLARITMALHAIQVTPEMENPWISDALDIPVFADAYHAPPACCRALIASARNVRPDTRFILDAVQAFVEDRMDAFDHEREPVLVHADLHFRNVLVVETRVTGLIDFEGCRPASPDVELDTLIRFLGAKRQFGSASTNDYSGAIGWFREGYPELFARPGLVERLEIYEAMWHLVQLHHWKREYTSLADPVAALSNLLTGVFRRRIIDLLAIDQSIV